MRGPGEKDKLDPARPGRYRACRLCPRRCGVDRVAGVAGRCGETAACRVASYGPHFGEEPSFSGTRGSGAIFFSGCSSGCFFCQNYQISIEHRGVEMTVDELLAAALSMAGPRGVHNLNFVTPDHFWPHIRELCARVRAAGADVPFLFNSSGYQDPGLVEEYAGVMDMFMPDFKFAEPELARRCMGDEDYPRLALESLRRMVGAKGFLAPWDPTGSEPARQGVLVRHLILPGHVENSLAVLDLLREEFGTSLPISVMSQFRPVPACGARGELDRGLTAEEHRRVTGRVGELGFKHVYVQHLRDTADFMPDFRRRAVFSGNRRRGPG
ncbi:MAG TPA: radical SAM protein [Kiritimatiellia bacterium]|nr:radical SAM protein [Kiritimatiellia bacterium]HRZ13137.1 radical SAM protein [Kiritimatiellia bacterium]HSA17558.1 radical SAM protein [Kiritimatiellia bacterium]